MIHDLCVVNAHQIWPVTYDRVMNHETCTQAIFNQATFPTLVWVPSIQYATHRKAIAVTLLVAELVLLAMAPNPDHPNLSRLQTEMARNAWIH